MLRLGYDADLGSFVQYYGLRPRPDASLLMIPPAGFLFPSDPRVVGTVAAIERDLLRDGFVERYRADLDNVGVTGSCRARGLPVLVLAGRGARAAGTARRSRRAL